MNARIADEIDQEFRNSDGSYHSDPTRDNMPLTNEDVLTELLDGQQHLITAQHKFLHDRDLQALAAAQRVFVACQTRIMQRLGVFG